MNHLARFAFFVFRMIPPLLLAIPFHGLHAQETVIGTVIQLRGNVEAVTPDGTHRPLSRGAEIHPLDLILTGADGRLQVRMADGALISFKPGTEFEFSEFIFDGPQGAGDSAIMTLIKGGFRTMSGSIGDGQGDEYQVLTDFASIGIRGTTHEAVISPQDNALYTGVSDGGTTVSNPLGSLELGVGADFDFSRTLPGQAPIGLLAIPRTLASYDLAALAAPQEPPAAAAAPEQDEQLEAASAVVLAASGTDDNEAATPAVPAANDDPAAGDAAEAPVPGVALAATDNEAASAPPALPPAAGNGRNEARVLSDPAPAPTLAVALAPTQEPAPAPAAAQAPTPASVPAPAALAGNESTVTAPPAIDPPDIENSPGLNSPGPNAPRIANAGNAPAPAAAGQARGSAQSALARNNGKAAGSGNAAALAEVLNSIRGGTRSPARKDDPPSVLLGRGRNNPVQVLAENTGDDTDAVINPVQNVRDLVSLNAGGPDRQGGNQGNGNGKGKNKGNGSSGNNNGDEDEEAGENGRSGAGRGNNGKGNRNSGPGEGRGRPLPVPTLFSALAQAVKADEPETVLLFSGIGQGPAAQTLAVSGAKPGIAPRESGPAMDFGLNWGYWDAQEPIISEENASGALTPWNELAYWARVLPADMRELRALSARWRFDTPSGQAHFIGGGSAGALTALDMGFQVDLASGRISQGEFRAELGQGAQSWSLNFSGQLRGAQAAMDSFTNTSISGPAGTLDTPVEGELQGVFTGTADKAGFAAGFSLNNGAGAHLDGLGLLDGAPQ